jgi:glucose-1-phosphatase
MVRWTMVASIAASVFPPTPRRHATILTMQPTHEPDISVLLFDVGGVLIEVSGIETMLEWLGNTITAEELWIKWLRSASVRQFETGKIEASEFALAVTREFGLDIEPKRFLESFAGWPRGLYPGAMEMLARIPARYRRALLSNSNALHWPRLLNDMGLKTAFEHRFVSHLTGKIKPDGAAFEDVINSFGCAPEQVLFLDDNLLNVEAAAGLGMRAVRVVGPGAAQRVLTDFGIIEEHRHAANRS